MFHGCLSGTHIQWYSLFLWFCNWLRSALTFLQSECTGRTVQSSDCSFLGRLGMLQICVPWLCVLLFQTLLLVMVLMISGITRAWLDVVWLHQLRNLPTTTVWTLHISHWSTYGTLWPLEIELCLFRSCSSDQFLYFCRCSIQALHVHHEGKLVWYRRSCNYVSGLSVA